MLRSHADARVAHGKRQSHCVPILLQGADRHDDLAELGEFDRVVAQVYQHLSQAQWVSQQMCWHRRVHIQQQFQALFFRLQSHQVGQVVQYVFQVEIDGFEFQLARLDLGEIQDVVDNAQQTDGTAIDLVHVVVLFG